MDSPKNISKPDTSQSVIKAFDLLDRVSKKGKVSVAELVRETGMSKTVVIRMLNSLKSVNLVRQDPDTKQYFAWLALYEMGMRVLGTSGLHQSIRSAIIDFVIKENVDALLGQLDGDHVLYVEKFEHNALYRIIVTAGNRIPLISAASGMAILSYLPPHIQRVVYDNNVALSNNGYRPNWESLEKSIQETRGRGYHLDRGIYKSDVCAIGVPLFNPDGTVTHSVVFPQFISQTKWDDILSFAQRAKKLSHSITSDSVS